MAADKRFNTVLTGFLPGLLLPAITLLVFWMIRYEGGLGEFLSSFQQMNMLSKVVSLAAIPNLLLLFGFIWTDRYYSARGVILATLLVALGMLDGFYGIIIAYVPLLWISIVFKAGGKDELFEQG